VRLTRQVKQKLLDQSIKRLIDWFMVWLILSQVVGRLLSCI